MWSVSDKRFLRSLRIELDDPPPPLPPLPRFYAMPTRVAGRYRVIDGKRRKLMCDFGPEKYQDPRAAAEAYAQQMNERPKAKD